VTVQSSRIVRRERDHARSLTSSGPIGVAIVGVGLPCPPLFACAPRAASARTATAVVGTAHKVKLHHRILVNRRIARFTSGAPTGTCRVHRPEDVAHEASSALGTVARLDGGRHVTLDKELRHNYSQDEPKAVSGDGSSDAFNGRRFTWHLVAVDKPGGSSNGAASSYRTGGDSCGGRKDSSRGSSR
jgi:hypothetical protein